MTHDPRKRSPALLREMVKAQRLAFGPLLFHAARALRDRGVLAALVSENPDGLTAAQVAERCEMSTYGATVLLEAGSAAELVRIVGEAFVVTRAGYLFDKDPLTRKNTDFVADVCYRAAEFLDESITQGRPAGLHELGPWETVYEGLSQMSEPAKTSWFAFDHYYSEMAFAELVPRLLERRPGRVLDIGGNTGKFAAQVLEADPDVVVTIADLPPQLETCRRNLAAAGLSERARFHDVSLLDPRAELPGEQDLIWMSQFLCCFSENEVKNILKLAAASLAPRGRLCILETFWDRQRNTVGEVCLQATSLYFTCVANGNSRMYDEATLLELIRQAGLVVAQETHEIAWGHSLLECTPKDWESESDRDTNIEIS